MAVGDTYVWCPTGTVKDHLWIVISDPIGPDALCVVINLTESFHGENAFTLKPGQHPYIYKDSDVNFGDAFLTSQNDLIQQVKYGSAKPHAQMDGNIVSEIILRAKTHPAFMPKLRKYLPN